MTNSDHHSSATASLDAPAIGPDADAHGLWTTRFVRLLGVVLVARMVYAAIVPLDLISDESYYWEWSRRPAWGYYSKPPMIAWLIAASTRLFGSTEFTVRLPAVLLSTAGLIPVFLLARRLYDARVAFWTMLAVLASPGGVVSGLLMTIDAPLLCCWATGVYAVWRMLEPDSKWIRWCLLATLATGLGLLSKQTMLALPALVGLFLLLRAEDRRQLARPGVWLWGCGSLLFLVPVLWWNAANGWITFEHTQHHFEAETVSLGKRLGRAAEYMGGQFGVVSPVTCWLVAIVFAGCFLAFTKLARRERFLLMLSGVPLYGVVLLSFKQRVQPNWPAPFYVCGLILATGWALGQFDLAAWTTRWRSHFRPGLVVGAILGGITLLVPYAALVTSLGGTEADPTRRLRGWEEFGTKIQEVRTTLPSPEGTFLVTVGDRANASELAFYLPDQPKVHRWNSGNRIESQYELWPRLDEVGRDGLIVVPAGVDLPPDLAGSFGDVRRLSTTRVPLGGETAREYDVYFGRSFGGWPKPAPLAARAAATRG